MQNSTQQTIEKKDVVIDRGKGQISDLWKKEDYLAIWLGFIILIVGLLIFIPRPGRQLDGNLVPLPQIRAGIYCCLHRFFID